MKKENKILYCLMAAVGIFGTVAPTNAVAAPDMGRNDPGVQLGKAREAMERERVARQIAEDEAARKNKVEQGEKPSADETQGQVTFELKKVNVDASVILSEDEIAAVTGEYVGRSVSLDDLREMVDKINKIYEEKGYMVCRAFLPAQRISGGEVSVRLVEGKTGEIGVVGNKHTKTSYVTKRFTLTPGTVDNTQRLNRDLQWFNATNDAQARLVLEPGSAPGTTDYKIIVYEPSNQALTLLVDNNGYETTGRWREGLFYNYRSLTGNRDGLHAQYIHAIGSDAWGTGYSAPLNKRGMKLDLDYTANSTEIKKGELKPLGVEGKAHSIGATWRMPFFVDADRRYEMGIAYVNQKSQTDLGKGTNLVVRWVDDKINRVTPYFSFTHYGDSSVFYHRHAWAITHRKDIYGITDNGNAYQLSGFWQKRYKNGNLFQFKFDGQLSSSDYLASSDRFYIGGANSIRGYEESFMGGEKGVSASLEYHVPFGKKRPYRAFVFVDAGTVSGNSAPQNDKSLAAGGVGLSINYKQISTVVTLGIPFKKELNGQKVDSARVNFLMTGTI